MSVDILEIADQELIEKEKQNQAGVSGVKRGKMKKCRVCGMSTYQKEGLCVLCKTGIREASDALMAE
jgi:hypothetical protein